MEKNKKFSEKLRSMVVNAAKKADSAATSVKNAGLKQIYKVPFVGDKVRNRVNDSKVMNMYDKKAPTYITTKDVRPLVKAGNYVGARQKIRASIDKAINDSEAKYGKSAILRESGEAAKSRFPDSDFPKKK
jgi:hypothetical protein